MKTFIGRKNLCYGFGKFNGSALIHRSTSRTAMLWVKFLKTKQGSLPFHTFIWLCPKLYPVKSGGKYWAGEWIMWEKLLVEWCEGAQIATRTAGWTTCRGILAFPHHDWHGGQGSRYLFANLVTPYMPYLKWGSTNRLLDQTLPHTQGYCSSSIAPLLHTYRDDCEDQC